MDYLESKVSETDLTTIFKNSNLRSMFIWQYPYFGVDGNDAFYEEFIENNISKYRFNVQEDAIELSIALDFFKTHFLTEIKRILYSRRGGLIKIVCSDWLWYFFQEIPEEEFIEINEYTIKHTTYDLLKVQGILNILLIKPDSKLMDRLMVCLAETKYSTMFYRLINKLDTDQLIQRFSAETVNAIKGVAIANHALSADSKTEIVAKLSALCH